MRTHPLTYSLQIHGLAPFAVREVTGVEQVFAPFRFDVRLDLRGGLPGAPEDLVKSGAILHLLRDDVPVRRVAGVVTEISSSLVFTGAPEVRVVLEPQLALLRHRVDYRVFRDKTVPQIVTEVVSTVGIRGGTGTASGLSLRLSGSYATRPYTVQCRESDLDFVHRLLEEEGIFYYFLEDGSLALGDSPAAYEAIAGASRLAFNPTSGMEKDEESVLAIARRASVSIGKITLGDYNLDKPSLDLFVSDGGPTDGGPEHYDYPAKHQDPASGARTASLLREAYAAASSGFAGSSDCARLIPGHTFTLDGSYAEGRHVITKLTHAWRQHHKPFAVAFASLDADVACRPVPTTPEPNLPNPMTGIVTGPGDIHTNATGQVKVHFPWDRVQGQDENCSHWIPVLQDNTGKSLQIPRVGWEVLVHFLEGNPDQPVVLGRMYNTEYPFPYSLPKEKTKTALRSLSSPGRNGTNQIELEDKAGDERITVLCEKDQKIIVENDRREIVQRDETNDITQDQTVEIGQDQTKTVGGNFAHTVEGNQKRLVKRSRERTVDGTETAVVTQNRTLIIGGMHDRRTGTDDVVQAKNLTEKVGAVNLEAFVKTNSTTSNERYKMKVGAAHLELVGKGKSESYAKKRSELIGGVAFTQAGGQINVNAKRRITSVLGLMRVRSKDTLTIDAGYVMSMLTGAGTFSGKSVVFKAGASSVTLQGNKVIVDAKKLVTISGAGGNKLAAAGVAMIPGAEKTNAVDGAKTGGAAGKASGDGKTGSGSVDAKGSTAAGSALGKLAEKGDAAAGALKDAAKAGFKFDPLHAVSSLGETLRSYAKDLGIRPLVDGASIPVSDVVHGVVDELGNKASEYAKAKVNEVIAQGAQKLQDKALGKLNDLLAKVPGGSGILGKGIDWAKGEITDLATEKVAGIIDPQKKSVTEAVDKGVEGTVDFGKSLIIDDEGKAPEKQTAEELRDAGNAWETVSSSDATDHANQGGLVVAAHPGATSDGSDAHVAVVVPSEKKADDQHPNVSGGGPGDRASDGSKTADQVWPDGQVKGVTYYKFVPPSGTKAP
jgi:type VI secretion system secreted protein VgrG